MVASVWVSYAQYWGEATNPAGFTSAQFPKVLARRVNESFNTISGNPLVQNLTSLDRARPLGLRWFRGGASWIGITCLTVSFACVAVAIAAASARDRRTRPALSPSARR